MVSLNHIVMCKLFILITCFYSMVLECSDAGKGKTNHSLHFDESHESQEVNTAPSKH